MDHSTKQARAAASLAEGPMSTNEPPQLQEASFQLSPAELKQIRPPVYQTAQPSEGVMELAIPRKALCYYTLHHVEFH